MWGLYRVRHRGSVRNKVRQHIFGKDMAKATLTSKGQITIPKEIREHLGVDAGDRLNFEPRSGGDVLVQAETVDLRSLRGALKRRGKRVSLSAMAEAIRRGASSR
jgi:AbrB family looped-hinge helix DNA binding protein